MKKVFLISSALLLSISLLSSSCGGGNDEPQTPACITQKVNEFKGNNSTPCSVPVKIEEFNYNGSKIYKLSYIKTLLCADVPSVEWLDASCNMLCTEGGGRGSNNCAFTTTPSFSKIIWKTETPQCILDKITEENGCTTLQSIGKYSVNGTTKYKLSYNLTGNCADVPTLIWLNSDCSTHCFNGGIAGNMCNVQGETLLQVIL